MVSIIYFEKFTIFNDSFKGIAIFYKYITFLNRNKDKFYYLLKIFDIYRVINFRPVIPHSIKNIQKNRIALTGSLNKMIPRTTVPKVPIPVHIA